MAGAQTRSLALATVRLSLRGSQIPAFRFFLTNAATPAYYRAHACTACNRIPDHGQPLHFTADPRR